MQEQWSLKSCSLFFSIYEEIQYPITFIRSLFRQNDEVYIYQMKYQSTNHAKYYLKCHIIFSCKYRKKLLTGHLKNEMYAIFKDIESRSDFQIDVFESDIDHIHFLISYIPRLSITSIVRRLKQESTTLIWQKYPYFLKQYFWREKTFWSDGYFVSSVGEASEETIEKYIRNQG